MQKRKLDKAAHSDVIKMTSFLVLYLEEQSLSAEFKWLLKELDSECERNVPDFKNRLYYSLCAYNSLSTKKLEIAFTASFTNAECNYFPSSSLPGVISALKNNKT